MLTRAERGDFGGYGSPTLFQESLADDDDARSTTSQQTQSSYAFARVVGGSPSVSPSEAILAMFGEPEEEATEATEATDDINIAGSIKKFKLDVQ